MRLKAMRTGAALMLFLVACKPHASTPLGGFLKDKQAAAFVFLAADCPLSQAYIPTLNQLREQFQSRSVEFYAVFAGKVATDDFVSTYKVALPVVHDSDFRLVDFFGATKTPEVFVVDADERVIYQGAVDNWAPELGQLRTVITQHYLLAALNSLLDHQPVSTKRTEAVGCFIER